MYVLKISYIKGKTLDLKTFSDELNFSSVDYYSALKVSFLGNKFIDLEETDKNLKVIKISTALENFDMRPFVVSTINSGFTNEDTKNLVLRTLEKIENDINNS